MLLKNEFVNSISLNNQFFYFLNTYGSLYSIDRKGKLIGF